MENDVIWGYKIAPARRMACAVYPSRRQRAQSGRPFFELIDGSWSAEPPTLRDASIGCVASSGSHRKWRC